MLRCSLVLLVGLVLHAPRATASWADAMFESLVKDFGSVPRGPTVTHYFRFTNNSGSPVHIASLRVSCGCVSAVALQSEVAPGQTGTIQANMDTNRFSGMKQVTVFVTFDRPSWEEVRLLVQANGRDDMAVSPQMFAFGSIKRGSEPTSTVTLSFYGGGAWQVQELERESNFILLEAKEVLRNQAQVSYHVTAKLRHDTPVGKWFTDVWVKTNNPSMPKVRVPLTVEVESPLSVSPSTVELGKPKPGEEVERKVIVRGVKPFRIKEVQGIDDKLAVQETNTDPKPVHVLTVKLKAGEEGDFTRKLKVLTDLPEDGEIEFQARAVVAK